jgi:hypothetical protein
MENRGFWCEIISVWGFMRYLKTVFQPLGLDFEIAISHNFDDKILHVPDQKNTYLSDQISTVSHQFSTISDQISTISDQISTISHQIPTISNQFSTISHQISTVSYQKTRQICTNRHPRDEIRMREFVGRKSVVEHISGLDRPREIGQLRRLGRGPERQNGRFGGFCAGFGGGLARVRRGQGGAAEIFIKIGQKMSEK